MQASVSMEVPGAKRKQSPRCYFLYKSRLICKEMFLCMYGISYSTFCRLKDHYQNHRISQRIHGNTKRLPPNTLLQAVAEDAKTFLNNYVEGNAVLLPRQIPGYKSNDIKLLSSSDTKTSLWREFQRACEQSNKQSVSYTKFIDLWEQFHPNLVFAKPMTCVSLVNKIPRSFSDLPIFRTGKSLSPFRSSKNT